MKSHSFPPEVQISGLYFMYFSFLIGAELPRHKTPAGTELPTLQTSVVWRRKQGTCQHLKIIELYSYKGNIRDE